jgi:putative two-component system response regulator
MERSAHILIVDDIEANRDLLHRRMARLGHVPHLAEDGFQALDFVEKHRPDIILLDIDMPGMSGYQVLERLKADPKTFPIPVIFISAHDDDDSIVKGLKLGAEDYVPKTFTADIVKARVSACLERKRLRDQQIASAQLATIFALSKLAESRDPETGEHLERMRSYCRILAEYLARDARYASILTQDTVENLYNAAPLHDIGKVSVPDTILRKPGKLTDEEFAMMKTHTVEGARTLRAVDQQHPGNDFIRLGIELVEGHHEKWDGTGYPYGKAGTDIPLVGRIAAVGDVYDALCSRRCYKPAMPLEKARAIILDGRGKHFDPDLVECFLTAEPDFLKVRERFQGE